MIYIWLRQVVDWEDEEAFWAQVPPRFKPRAELWNATIKMPFHVFRHRVREIAACNQSRVENAIYADWDEIPDGARVVPVDDDDWFAPDLAEVLGREWGEERGVSWSPAWIGVPADVGHRIYLIRRGLLPFTPPHWTCESNNYALVKDAGSRLLLEKHGEATDWFDGPGRDAVKRIGRRISIYNRHLGSQTSLRPTKYRGELTRARLLRRIRYHKWLYRRRRLPRELAWCRPYVAMMDELMSEVEPR